MKSFVLPTRDDTYVWIGAFILTLVATIAAAAYCATFFLELLNPERYSASYDGPWLVVSPGPFVVFFCLLTLVVIRLCVDSFRSVKELTTDELLERLGAGRVTEKGSDLATRRLLNIVEEIAIASGRSVPATWVMSRESGINAFTAGTTPWNTAICVTSGALRYLRRAELQAVVAHEFGHIANGDVRRNTFLLRILATIAWRDYEPIKVQVIATLVLAATFVLLAVGLPYLSQPVSPIFAPVGFGILVFLVLMVPTLVMRQVWRLGVTSSRLAHAAFARRCELVADALAVQFIREPAALASVLRKIGGLATTTHLATDHAVAVAHMCIAPALARWYEGAFASHPPLADRLRHLGFPLTLADLDELNEYDPSTLSRYLAEVNEELGLMHFDRAGARAPQPTPDEMAPVPRRAMSLAEALDAKPDLDHAKKLLARIPWDLRDALRTPAGARAAAHALLAHSTATASIEPSLARRYRDLLDRLGETYRLPLLELTMPALLALHASEREAFRAELRALMFADGQATARELALFLLLTKPLAAAHPPASSEAAGDAFGIVLGAAVYAFTANAEDARAAFDAGLREGRFMAALPAAAAITVERLEQALERLGRIPPLVKPKVTRAIAAAVCHDGRVTARELEFVRAVGAALDCPIPPLAATAEEAR